jgi:hypothetical protein
MSAQCVPPGLVGRGPHPRIDVCAMSNTNQCSIATGGSNVRILVARVQRLPSKEDSVLMEAAQFVHDRTLAEGSPVVGCRILLC